MSFKNLLVRALAIATVGASAMFVSSSPVMAAERYTTVEPAQPSDTTGKIEVLEFFAYSCPHCARIEPMVEAWAKTLPDNVVLKQVPVAFNASMKDLQKLYYTLEALDRLDLHAKVFDAIHKEHQQIYDAKAITGWIADQGIDAKAFQDVFNSFGIQSKITRADELTKVYNIDGTPSLAVAGKYVTSPTQTGSYEGTIKEAQSLLEKAEH
ncbi:thiol:disulfide interchange protein DsbA/DsbL [Allopusillimonas ginsengisoli]|jgi:thiol:disulfide interchange protein DsbA|uniref:thiol:disulfide interchange protein DsbA/DsbL n=1 Tax=Allopusillimonas ginsengisoli TaxID=453575 RepID=UPI0010C195E2|nr:thiol:disulfide interchange protein DsbA/DsbL [Allopusillimonas ginsengisoli]